MYLLEGRQVPDHSAIARFRSEHFAKCADLFLSQMAQMLLELEQITTTEVFIDGTKIEASANKYTFVWKKSVTVNSGFIVAAGVFPNPTDVMTLKPFMEQMESSLRFKFDRIVADAGYESEENLVYLRDKEIEAYIKPSNYEQLGTKKFAREIGRKESMQYDKDGDYYICHNGKKIVKTGVKTRKTSSGYLREETHYECKSCSGCPYSGKCPAGKNCKKPLKKRHKKLTVSRLFEELREEEYRLINSEEGKMLRMNRSIQAEGGFADIKGDSGFTRFLSRGTDNVFAEYVLYAMAHNLGWLHSRIQNDKLDLHLYELKEGEKNAA